MFYNLEISSNTVTDTISLVNHKLNSGEYGILIEESGMMLLAKNYKGNTTDFVPYKTTAFNSASMNFMPPGNQTIQRLQGENKTAR